MKNCIFYEICYTKPHQRFVDIEISYTPKNESKSSIFQIAAWRPGRYELQQYAKNIQKVSATDSNGKPLVVTKTDRNSWQVQHEQGIAIKVTYRYFAMQMDAGGCWLDHQQVYLNFISCLLYLKDGKDLPCELKLNLPTDYIIACGLQNVGGVINANSFYQLADSPMMASATIEQASYFVHNVPFHCWFMGKNELNKEQLVSDFEKFTKAQLEIFGSFPFKEYHFLIQCLPYPHYHGVEHTNSTVIVLGPAESLHEKSMYEELLGISSHELFHAWNACTIKPKELLPYNFSTEQYFESGFVLEGFTTYYGDLLLAKSGIFDEQRYLQALNDTLKKHFHNFANENLSLAASSLDLWIDGYSTGIPDRKVSIYGKGCVVACLIDMAIRQKTNHHKSLDDVMVLLWNEFGKKSIGYTVDEVFNTINLVASVNISVLLTESIYGTTNLKEILENLVVDFGLALVCKTPEETSQSRYGMKLSNHSNGFLVEQIAPGSPADQCLSRGDVVMNVQGWNKELFENHLKTTAFADITVWRDHRQHLLFLQPDGAIYFQWHELEINTKASDKQIMARAKWLGKYPNSN